MRKTTIVLAIIALFSASCGIELVKVDIELEKGFVPEVAISSYMVADSTINLKLVLSQASYSTSHSNTPTLKNATIERLSDNQTFVLSQSIQNNYIQLYSEEVKPIAGGIYKMHVETQNPVTVLESIDTVPDVTPILNAEILPVENNSNQLGRLTFKPNLTSIGTNFYEIAIFICDKSSIYSTNTFYQIPVTTNDQIITHEDYYPSMLLIGAFEPQSLLFSVKKPNEIVKISFVYRGGTAQSSKGISTLDHDLKIELRSVSRAYFMYKTSVYEQNYAANGDLLYGMAAPVTVSGNIKGGSGVFASYSKSDTTISVAGRTGLKE